MIHPPDIVRRGFQAKEFAGPIAWRYTITMQLPAPSRDPMALTAGLPARLALAGAALAAIWAMVLWAW